MTTATASNVCVEQRLEDMWEQLLAHRFALNAKPQARPEAVLIFGQPGSGKSVLAEAVRRDFVPRGGAVSIDLTDLQLLHPAAGVPKERRSPEIDDCLVSSAGYAAARMLIAATEHRQHLVAACRVEAEANAAALVKDLHEQGYLVTVLVLIVSRDVSWQRVIEFTKSTAGECLPAIDRSQHDRLCEVLVEALSRLEEQGLADSVCWLDSTGRVLASMTLGVDWTSGPSRRLLAEHSPASGARDQRPPPPRNSRHDEHQPEFSQRTHPLEPPPACPASSLAKPHGGRPDSSTDRQLERRREFLRILQLRAENETRGRG